jgi:two-component system sensor kinase FixL
MGERLAPDDHPKCEVPEDVLFSEALLWDIVDSVNDAVVTIDENHRVLVCNKAAEEMFGYSYEEIIGKDVSPLIPDPHNDIHQGYVERYIETGIARVIGKAPRECIGRRRDGSTFPIEISYSASSTKGRLYFTAVIRDVSQRKQMERELRLMEKLAGVGKAVAHVVHEIRKPLMLIGGFASQVEHCKTLEGDPKNRHKLKIVMGEVKRLETLLNSIRLLTRPPAAGLKTPIAINRVLQETFELLEPMLSGTEVSLGPELDPGTLIVLGDSDGLKQVFLNLLENAIEAMGGAGTIRVISRRLSSVAEIVIEDNGPGIPEELHEKIFDPFFTTKPEGTGLGLAICRNIIQDHGGTLTIRSSQHGGCAFILSIPIHSA